MRVKRRIKMLAGLVVIAAAVLPSTGHAQDYEGGNWRVTGYRTGSDGSLFTLSPAPNACGGGTDFGEHIRIVENAANRQEIIASLMTAYLTGEKLSGIWFNNSGPCFNGHSLAVHMIRMAGK